MLGILENSLHLLGYLLHVLKNYLRDSPLFYKTLERERMMEWMRGRWREGSKASILRPEF